MKLSEMPSSNINLKKNITESLIIHTQNTKNTQ